MPRKSTAKQATSKYPVAAKSTSIRPKYDETIEQTHLTDERYSTNELVIQNVPSTKSASGRQWREFVRPDEPEEPNPDEVWDTHEPDEQLALNCLFDAYAKNDPSTRLELVRDNGESIVRVWKAKPKKENDDPDAAFPSVHFDISDERTDKAGRIVAKLHRVLAGADGTASRDPYDDTSNAIPNRIDVEDCGALFDFVGELAELVSSERLSGDPGRSYPLDERLRQIFERSKGMSK